MNKGLKTFPASQLCLTGMGEKWHIRQGNKTYCGHTGIISIARGVIGVREDYERICKRCIRLYHIDMASRMR